MEGKYSKEELDRYINTRLNLLKSAKQYLIKGKKRHLKRLIKRLEEYKKIPEEIRRFYDVNVKGIESLLN